MFHAIAANSAPKMTAGLMNPACTVLAMVLATALPTTK